MMQCNDWKVRRQAELCVTIQLKLFVTVGE